MAELVVVLDTGGRITYTNPAWHRAMGYTPDEVPQLCPEELVAPEDRGRYRAAVRRVLSGEKVVDFEAVLLTKSGARIVCRGSTCPYMAEGASGVPVFAGALIICSDVTAERRAEVTRARLATTLDVSPDLVSVMTADERVVYLNRAGRRMLGLPEDTDLSTLSPADAHPPEEWQRIQAEALPAAIRHGVWRGESVLLSATGERIPVSQVIVAHPSFRPDESPYFFSTISSDLSERVRAARLKDELIGIVSHELRTPVGIVSGALDFLQRQLTVTGRQAELLSMAIRNTDRALLLINDLLHVERLESGTFPLDRHPVSVAELLSTAHAGTQLAAQRAGIDVTIEVSGAVSETTVFVDAARTQQVLVNLITNAVKFSPSGSTITLSADAPEQGTVRLTVRDQGRGIPADMIDRVFDRFVQVHSDDAHRRGGAGLGLAIAKAIVEQHGGRIQVESDVGRGSAFHVILPAGTH